MSFNVDRVESAFTGLATSEPNTSRLEAEILATAAITTPLLYITWNEPDAVDRTIRMVFDGGGPLSVPELAALDDPGGVIVSHDGTNLEDILAPISDVVEDMPMTYQTADTVDIGVGKMADTTQQMLIVIDAPLTLDLTVSGLGGLDTGTKAASTWYAVYALGRVDGTKKAGLTASLNFTTPALPSTHDRFRRIGTIKNAAGDVLFKFVQVGTDKERIVIWDEDHEQLPQRVLAGGNSPGSFTPIDVQDVVPVSSVLASIQVESGPGNGKSKLRPNGIGGANGTHSIENNSQVADRILVPGRILDYETTGTSKLTIDVTGYTEVL